jgi:hypothetical protein
MVQTTVIELGAKARASLYATASGDSLDAVVEKLYTADGATVMSAMPGEIDALFKILKQSVRQLLFGKTVNKANGGFTLMAAGTVSEAMTLVCAEIEEAVSIGDATYLKQMMGVQEALNSIQAAGIAVVTLYLPVLRASQMAVETYLEEKRKTGADVDVLASELLNLLTEHRGLLPVTLPRIKPIVPYGYGTLAVPDNIDDQMTVGPGFLSHGHQRGGDELLRRRSHRDGHAGDAARQGVEQEHMTRAQRPGLGCRRGYQAGARASLAVRAGAAARFDCTFGARRRARRRNGRVGGPLPCCLRSSAPTERH